ncbi:MAG: O-acetyltransferase [Candidatus Beckwithbacteria bacterium GW2011_GWB1_47_15]|uniref:O-acetyltransferase n=1 Tax=Candidatus Beckwithbacteria bacterium GW2011_GWB1_47_15 TaxID=1618371 RepID=A0A0G1RUV3_9BACT|nr:MAG: o-acetyltransferase [Candidatus Beckwithbacteria bacterium GW2011_GWC1_49_16]KKU35687.1 MAG: O-acetyltransferase [Candidatus Beckwithbacteria bacterium GW2011_GWA1_46_30]KKU60886.1 MAG: O-acetyltransferase [Candidatus Beckwithbacteria bacterium GW2011_GWB1_47_15]KKU72246.1 MAG: O-acetyltransferase [Candidatus Beckwithbacteria bacterium GW2011_GWA2_47_25]KKW04994.1 MAG: O-acetyltransferase [Candidatus Beckwithbacteria bacterium GW2011_GWC2_49_11]OGD48943.1 MAG: acetyltransferase [Candid
MSRFNNWQEPEFDARGMTRWQWICQHHQNLKLGEGSDIGAFSYLNAKHGVEIGEEVQIGSHVSIYSENTIDNTHGRVVIKKGAKIGSHSVIFPGVTIGEKAVVGAFSLVKKDVPAGAVVAGVTAKPLERRNR